MLRQRFFWGGIVVLRQCLPQRVKRSSTILFGMLSTSQCCHRYVVTSLGATQGTWGVKKRARTTNQRITNNVREGLWLLLMFSRGFCVCIVPSLGVHHPHSHPSCRDGFINPSSSSAPSSQHEAHRCFAANRSRVMALIFFVRLCNFMKDFY